MVRNPHQFSLTYLDWDSIPEGPKSAIWKEIEDNVEDCLQEFRPVAMRACKKIWKDYKGKTKEKYYTKNEGDPDILLKVPKRVLPNPWKELVSYWSTEDAKKIAKRNSVNREWRGPNHRTGRTHLSHIRHEMSKKGEDTDKMSVFIKTRDENDPDVKAILEEFNHNLAEIPESLQTTEVRDRIFHKLLGEDGHGYCKTYGSGVPQSAIYGQSSRPSHASSSSTLNEITRQVREATQEIEQRLSVEIEQRLSNEIEQRLTREIEQKFAGEMERMVNEKIMAHLDRIGARATLFESYGESNEIDQVPNVNSKQPTNRASVGKEIQDHEQDASHFLEHSPRLNGHEDGQKVCLVRHYSKTRCGRGNSS